MATKTIARPAPSSRMRPIQPTPRWREVNGGLRLVALGYLVLLLLFLPSVALTWLARREVVAGFHLGAYHELCHLLGLLGASGAALLGYVLLLVGQWRCLVFVPRRHGAQELTFVCVLCLLVAPLAFLAAHLVGGEAPYRLWDEGVAGLGRLDLPAIGGGLQLVGLGLLVLNLVLFTQVMRVLALCLADQDSVRRGEAFLFVVCSLVGATVGAPLAPYADKSGPVIFVVLVLGWLTVLVWQTVLVFSSRRNIAASPLLQLKSLGRVDVRRTYRSGPSRPFSGFRRRI